MAKRKGGTVTNLDAVKIYTALLLIGAVVFVSFLIGAGLVLISRTSETQAVNSFLAVCGDDGFFEKKEVRTVELLSSFSLERFPGFAGQSAVLFRVIDHSWTEQIYAGLGNRSSGAITRCLGELLEIPGSSVRALQFQSEDHWFLVGEVMGSVDDNPLFVRLDIQVSSLASQEVVQMMPSVYGREFIAYDAITEGENQTIQKVCPIYRVTGSRSYGVEQCPVSLAMKSPFDMSQLRSANSR